MPEIISKQVDVKSRAGSVLIPAGGVDECGVQRDKFPARFLNSNSRCQLGSSDRCRLKLRAYAKGSRPVLPAYDGAMSASQERGDP